MRLLGGSLCNMLRVSMPPQPARARVPRSAGVYVVVRFNQPFPPHINVSWRCWAPRRACVGVSSSKLMNGM